MNAEKRNAIAARLEKIRQRNAGLLRPDDVLKDAKSESSPLHDQFEWDDAKAAHEHRLQQARELIRSVQVEINTTTKRVLAPCYIRDPAQSGDEQGYRPVLEIKTDAAVAADALRDELDRAIALLERALNIADALGMTKRLTEMLSQIKVLRESVAA